MKVVVLCGGRGLRFQETTEYRPKPLVEIGRKPILWHIMKTYAHYGYDDFILCLGYKGEMIKRYFLDYELMNNDISVHLSQNNQVEIYGASQEYQWKIILAETGIDALTGARIKLIEKYVDSDLFMLTYGDAVTDLNIKHLVEFHCSHKRIGTITAVCPPSRFGELCVNEQNIVETFKEKAVVSGSYINGGYFVFDHRLFEYVNTDDSCAFEGEPLTQLAKDGQLVAHIHNGYWQCMDTYRDWQLLNQSWESGQSPWKVW